MARFYHDVHRASDFFSRAYDGSRMLAEIQSTLAGLFNHHVSLGDIALTHNLSLPVPEAHREHIEQLRLYCEATGYHARLDEAFKAVQSANDSVKHNSTSNR